MSSPPPIRGSRATPRLASERAAAPATLAAGAALGGAIAWLLDEWSRTRAFRLELAPGETVSALSWLAVAAAAAGALAGCLGFVLARAGRPVTSRAVAALIVSAPLAAALAFGGHALLTGAWVARQPWVGPARIAVVATAIAGTWLVTLVVLGSAPRRPLRIAGGLAAVAVLVSLADQKLLPRLYPVLHLLASVLLLAAGAGAGAVLAARLRGAWAARIGGSLVLGGAVPLGLLAAGLLPGDDALGRELLLVHAPHSSRLLALAPQPARPDAASDADLLERLRPRPLSHPERLDRLAPGRRRMNIVLVTIDTLRADHVHALGYGRPTTPSLDELAGRSVLFETAYSQYPSTALAMAALFSGRLPSATALHLGEPVESDRPLGLRLKRAGWRVVSHTSFPQHIYDTLAYAHAGFDRRVNHDGPLEGDAVRTTDRLLAELDGLGGDRPLFLWGHYFDPHAYHRHHDEFDFGDSITDLYDGEIAHTDAQVGRLLAAVERRADRDRTIVIVHSDHGEELGEHGGEGHTSSCFEEQVAVPLIVSIPGVAPRRVARAVGLIDLVPTLVDLLDLERDGTTHGHSLVPLLWPDEFPDDLAARPDVVAMQLREGRLGAGTLDAVRRGRWKIIENVRTGTHDLYDLRLDPGETQSRVRDEPAAYADMLRYLRATQALARGDEAPSGDESPRTRLASAARCVAGFRMQEAAGIYERVIRDPAAPAAERVRALWAAGDFALGPAFPAVLEAAGDGSPEVREAAALALSGFRGRDEVKAALETLRRDVDEGVRRAASTSIHLADEPGEEARFAEPFIVGSASVPEDETALAIRALRLRRDPWLLPVVYFRGLVTPWRSYREARLAADAVLSYPLLDALPVVRGFLFSPDRLLRRQAEQHLMQAGRGDLLDVLRRIREANLEGINAVIGLDDVEAGIAAFERALGLARKAGFYDWGISLQLLQTLVGTGRAARAAELFEREARATAAGAKTASRFLARWAAVARHLDRAAVVNLRRMDGGEASPGRPARWHAKVAVELDEEGGSLPGLTAGLAPAFGLVVSREGRPLADPVFLTLPAFGLLPGERHVLEIDVPLPEMTPGPAQAHLGMHWQGRSLGTPLRMELAR